MMTSSISCSRHAWNLRLSFDESMQATTEGEENAAVGLDSLFSNTTGAQNVAMGRSSLNGNTSGAGNIGIGFESGSDNSTGSFNTFIGYQVGLLTGNITNSTLLGNGASTTASNTFVFGNGAITQNVTSGNILGNSGNISALTYGSGAGTGPSTVFHLGTALGGVIQFTTGSAPVIGGIIFTMTYAHAFPNHSFVVISPGDNTTAQLSGSSSPNLYQGALTTGFEILAGATALAASTTYTWYYHINGY